MDKLFLVEQRLKRFGRPAERIEGEKARDEAHLKVTLKCGTDVIVTQTYSYLSVLEGIPPKTVDIAQFYYWIDCATYLNNKRIRSLPRKKR